MQTPWQKREKEILNFGIANTYLFACIEPEIKEDRTPQENVIIIFLPDDSLPSKGKKPRFL